MYKSKVGSVLKGVFVSSFRNIISMVESYAITINGINENAEI